MNLTMASHLKQLVTWWTHTPCLFCIFKYIAVAARLGKLLGCEKIVWTTHPAWYPVSSVVRSSICMTKCLLCTNCLFLHWHTSFHKTIISQGFYVCTIYIGSVLGYEKIEKKSITQVVLTLSFVWLHQCKKSNTTNLLAEGWKQLRSWKGFQLL